MRPRHRLALACVTLAACSHPGALDRTERARLGGDVAQVGDIPIPASLVASVMATSGISASEAAHLLIDDAVAAHGAITRHLDEAEPARAELRAQRARFVARKVAAAIVARGPATASEIDALANDDWYDVDAPESVHVIHAVVLRKEGDSGVDDEGPAIGKALADAVEGAPSTQDFKARAQAVPHGARDVRVEELPPLTLEGRVVGPGDHGMDGKFARAAFELAAAGDTTRVVETSFGWHVIRLVERLPAVHLTSAELRERFASEVMVRRGRDLVAAILDERKRTVPIDVNVSADALLAEVHLDGP